MKHNCSKIAFQEIRKKNLKMLLWNAALLQYVSQNF